jgi:hypothetical protein
VTTEPLQSISETVIRVEEYSVFFLANGLIIALPVWGEASLMAIICKIEARTTADFAPSVIGNKWIKTHLVTSSFGGFLLAHAHFHR